MSEEVTVTQYNRPARTGDYGWVADGGRRYCAFVNGVRPNGTLGVEIHGLCPRKYEIPSAEFTPDPEAFWNGCSPDEPGYQSALLELRKRMDTNEKGAE